MGLSRPQCDFLISGIELNKKQFAKYFYVNCNGWSFFDFKLLNYHKYHPKTSEVEPYITPSYSWNSSEDYGSMLMTKEVESTKQMWELRGEWDFSVRGDGIGSGTDEPIVWLNLSQKFWESHSRNDQSCRHSPGRVDSNRLHTSQSVLIFNVSKSNVLTLHFQVRLRAEHTDFF